MPLHGETMPIRIVKYVISGMGGTKQMILGNTFNDVTGYFNELHSSISLHTTMHVYMYI